ncbi:acyl-CoA desaturase [Actinocrinis puniceicyclus]|uniref:Acyl-CoA desaturase n=1 Tax=Actinocrinis puniceicyclus TaxID=977794 RepID=A0A8J7WR11_9ACTN|nr:acyl-CoA desaturase [Actinocrinis puniceicyclus]MBS2964857.1 acyl-CoA desaturase [Actinocrinis puniceicyclus]
MTEQVYARVSAGKGRGSDFAELLRRVREAGLLERRIGYYAVKTAVTAALLAGAGVLFVVLGDTWWQLFTAGYLAVVFTQIGFVGHDAGHRQILRRRRAGDLVGILHANALIGLSYGWWVDKHNRHHAHPNEVGRDPDVGAGALVFTAGQTARRGRLGRLAARYQAWYFFPLLTLEGLNLHYGSIKSLLHRRDRGALLESGLLVLHVAAYVTVLVLLLSWGRALAFAAVNQAVFGVYLGCAFAPNHKGMPGPSEQDAADFLRRQVLSSRNVRGGPVTDWVLGGLNYQIEHHLFPSMPRVNLKRARPLVRAFCAERGISYRECSAFDSYRQALRHLRSVGAVVEV